MSRIRIHYCTQCQWLLRSAWYAQELLSTFGEALEEVALAHLTVAISRFSSTRRVSGNASATGDSPTARS